MGSQGNFNLIMQNTLSSIQVDYTYINYYVVLAYMPKNCEKDYTVYSNAIYPENI